MSDVKLKIKLKHQTAESPGVFEDSVLRVYIKGDRNLLKKVHDAIVGTLGKEGKDE